MNNINKLFKAAKLDAILNKDRQPAVTECNLITLDLVSNNETLKEMITVVKGSNNKEANLIELGSLYTETGIGAYYSKGKSAVSLNADKMMTEIINNYIACNLTILNDTGDSLIVPYIKSHMHDVESRTGKAHLLVHEVIEEFELGSTPTTELSKVYGNDLVYAKSVINLVHSEKVGAIYKKGIPSHISDYLASSDDTTYSLSPRQTSSLGFQPMDGIKKYFIFTDTDNYLVFNNTDNSTTIHLLK